MNRILVTGATGQLGSAVIETLVKKIPASQISILTRKEEKRVKFQAEGFPAYLGDYDDVDALEKAMAGVDTVLLISAGDEGNRRQQHQNVVNAAQKAGVKNIAYTSRSLKNRATLANKLMVDHFETEDYIIASGLKYAFFRNVLYLDAIPLFIGKQATETGISLPAGDGKVAYALRSEMGEAMAHVLLQEEWENKIYNFNGGKAYSFYDIAAALTELSGKEVKYTAMETTAFEGMMKQRGLPEPVIKKIVAFLTDIKQNQEAEIGNELAIHLGRKPIALKDGLKTLFGL
ncbi:NAD(P)-dependent oxidoreductase [Adhaeribacter arboris]|uniref:NAD(P)-dependent oxidoreductase n=1 Tax=Adhaeribacter arboris TaxID=2072846 RepID=A0A2T2YI12_9BACT|nr:SDR family oxidoreductase [Adhaeribacter arboris]PSR55141.1 NAD(P)-dependent oxidoreductase [Adhaeribacter arboris]